LIDLNGWMNEIRDEWIRDEWIKNEWINKG
jgi:hypothetical protein